jgi:hypothetical protein
MTLAQIETAIAYLPSQDLAALMRWLGNYVATQIDHDEWDNKIAADSKSGALDGFFADAMQQVQTGKTTNL